VTTTVPLELVEVDRRRIPPGGSALGQVLVSLTTSPIPLLVRGP
jgi:hypothetical protein